LLKVTDSLDSYSKAFETLKKIRTLVWKNHLGSANIDLEIGEKKMSLTVSPIQAIIIYQFQEKAEWDAKDLVSQSRWVALSLLYIRSNRKETNTCEML